MGAPLLAAITLGVLPADTYTPLVTLADVSGFAGIDLIARPSTQNNVEVFLSWYANPSSGPVFVGNDVLQLGKRSRFVDSVARTGRFFPAKGQLVTVMVKGLTAATYDGELSVIPVTVDRDGSPMLRFYEPQAGSDWLPGQVGVIDQLCATNVWTDVPFTVPAWGQAMISAGGFPPGGSAIRVQSFSYYDRLCCDQEFGFVGHPTPPVVVNLPGAAYHTLGFYQSSGAAFNPFASIITDLR